VLLVAVLLGIVGWQVRELARAYEPLPVLDSLGGEFALESTAGGLARLSDFRGKLVLIGFGYASCPDVCPTMLARMRDVRLALGGNGDAVQPLFVTLDPDRDTVDRLAPYVRHFDDSLIGLTGTVGAVSQAAASFRVYWEIESPSDIVHSSHVYLLDRQGRVRSTFGPGVTVPEMIATVQRLL
jgi:cytochrome oxidase Cu insertion factor (SCO1/SenC/PrrC family)